MMIQSLELVTERTLTLPRCIDFENPDMVLESYGAHAWREPLGAWCLHKDKRCRWVIDGGPRAVNDTRKISEAAR